jgi:hypothetical protein
LIYVNDDEIKMEADLEALTGVFSAFGLAASAGLNAYIPLLVVALVARFTDWIKLSEPWDVLTSGWIIGLLVVLVAVEFFADKVPAVNHVNDVIQTIIRPVAGAIVFAASAQVISDVHPVLAIAAGILVAGSVHAVKSVAVRPAVTATTGGAGNVPVSMFEDFLATILSILAIMIPVLIGIILLAAVGLLIWHFWRRRQAKEVALSSNITKE